MDSFDARVGLDLPGVHEFIASSLAAPDVVLEGDKCLVAPNFLTTEQVNVVIYFALKI
jgi:hypothetical protein